MGCARIPPFDGRVQALPLHSGAHYRRGEGVVLTCHIAGAALDVFILEPLLSTSPLRELQRAADTPHLWGSPAHKDRLSGLFAKNLRRYASGQAHLNLLDKETRS
jgi:phosphoglycerate dehydrogenase-like enzyme